MTIEDKAVADGSWHNVTLTSKFRALRLYLDGVEVGDELDMSIVHDFMDPYLTSVLIGASNKDVYNMNEDMFGELAVSILAQSRIGRSLVRHYNGWPFPLFQSLKDVWPISRSTVRSSRSTALAESLTESFTTVVFWLVAATASRVPPLPLIL